MEQVFADQPQAGSGQGTAPAVASFASSGEYSTLMLDRMGRILSCGAPAEKIFGASRARMLGRQISEYIVGLLLGGTSPSYRARYLVYLCANGEWQKFQAKDAHDGAFSVEINVSQMTASGQEIFLLTVRRPEASS
jgi:PAS domain S-box-containing protein